MGFRMRYIVPCIPPSNNQFIGRNKRWEYQNTKKQWAALIYNCVALNGTPNQPLKRARVELVYHFPDNRRRDPDNYSGKMILDGLTRAGIIADDSFFNIELRICANYEDKTGVTEIFIDELP